MIFLFCFTIYDVNKCGNASSKSVKMLHIANRVFQWRVWRESEGITAISSEASSCSTSVARRWWIWLRGARSPHAWRAACSPSRSYQRTFSQHGRHRDSRAGQMPPQNPGLLGNFSEDIECFCWSGLLECSWTTKLNFWTDFPNRFE